MLKVKTANNVKLQELDNQIQNKLSQAQTRKDQLEQEQLEKLKRNVSSSCFALSLFHHKPSVMQTNCDYKKNRCLCLFFFCVMTRVELETSRKAENGRVDHRDPKIGGY